jgi:ornithine carbamoyltransferase
MSKRHLLSITDLDPSEIRYLVDRGLELKSGQLHNHKPLAGNMIGIYFRKTSTRTRTSFTVGAAKLGAMPIVYGPQDLQTNTGESLEDTARVLSGYLDALVVRTAESLAEMQTLAGQSAMPVINAMSENEHPTQALADLTSIKEHFGRLEDLHLLYFGEANNSATALTLAISRIPNMRLSLFTPEGYGLPLDVRSQALADAARHGSRIEEFHSLDHLPSNADIVYTTRWQTTGSSKLDPNWRTHFGPFAVTQALMERVSKPGGTIFMHDLPAVRGEDVASEVLDGPQSIAFQQAQNKLFSAMAVLEWCVAGS